MTNNTGNSSSSGDIYGKDVDQAKAIALPLLMILTLIVAVPLTRHSLSAALGASTPAKDFRRFLILTCSLLAVVLSVFLQVGPSWEYGIASALVSFGMVLSCAPGMLEDDPAPIPAQRQQQQQAASSVEALFYAPRSRSLTLLQMYSFWWIILTGLMDGVVSDGLIASVSVAKCHEWFPSTAPGAPREKICGADHYEGFVATVCIGIMVLNFFVLMSLCAIVFQPEDGYQSIDGGGATEDTSASAAGVGGSFGSGGPMPDLPSNAYHDAHQ